MLQKDFGFPSTNIYTLADDDTSLKIQEVRSFIEKSHITPHYHAQFFVIENIKRLSLESSHALLKFLEEPGIWNIVFLSNQSESGVLDTILSRVVSVPHHWSIIKKDKDFVVMMIEQYIEKKDTWIVNYYFSKNISSEDALDFLFSLIVYIQKTWQYNEMLSCIQEDLQGIENNNFSPKYIIDKYLLELWAIK